MLNLGYVITTRQGSPKRLPAERLDALSFSQRHLLSQAISGSSRTVKGELDTQTTRCFHAFRAYTTKSVRQA